MGAADSNLFFDLTELAGLGRGAIIGKTVRLRKPGKTWIGDYSILDDFAYVSCALRVGRYTHIGPHAICIGGDAEIVIGDFVNISGGCRLMAASNDFTGGGLVGPAIPAEFSEPAVVGRIEIGDHALFGANTVVLPNTRVPEGVATGAFTLLTSRTALTPWTLYAGIPARPIRPRDGARMRAAARRLLERDARPG
jgi:acetyltransferase-like isoleucine patch superfamily enzyme